MKGTWKPKAAGILNIISGAFFFIGGITILSLLGQPATATPWASTAQHHQYSPRDRLHGERGTTETTKLSSLAHQ